MLFFQCDHFTFVHLCDQKQTGLNVGVFCVILDKQTGRIHKNVPVCIEKLQGPMDQ